MNGDAAVAVTDALEGGAEVVKLAAAPEKKGSSKPKKAKKTKATKAAKKPAKKTAKASKTPSAGGHKAQTQVDPKAWKALCAAAKTAGCSTPAEWIRDTLYKKLSYKAE